MNRKRLYAIHYAPQAIPGATMKDYARDYYLNGGTAPRGRVWVFYRQDAAGHVTAREYQPWGNLSRLTNDLARLYQTEEDPRTGTVRFEVGRRRGR